ncbi:MAG: two-component regulator propeller domain-containing protein [Bacteroidota bacterium]
MRLLPLSFIQCLCFCTVWVLPPLKALGRSPDQALIPLEIQGETFSKEVNVLFEDSFGYLWIGTKSGLYRYDGNGVKAYQYDVFDDRSLANNGINSIVEDAYNNLWIGSESYLIVFDRNREEFRRYYKNRTAICLLKTGQGVVWANLNKVGLLKIIPHPNLDSVQFNTAFNYISNQVFRQNKQVKTLVEDERGQLIAGSRQGLFFLYGNGHLKRGTYKKEVISLQSDKEGGLWVASTDEVCYLRYDAYRGQVFQVKKLHFPTEPISSLRISTLFLSQDKQLWIGTNQGLYRASDAYTSNRVQAAFQSEALSGKQISHLEIDRYKNLWIASTDGVEKFVDRLGMFQYTALSSLEIKLRDDKTQSILEDERGKIWIGTQLNGIYFFDPISQKARKIAFPGKRINRIKRDRYKNNLLIGSEKVLYALSLSDSTWGNWEIIGRTGHTIRDWIQISENEIWVGTWEGGIYIFSQDEARENWRKALQKTFQKHHISTLLLDASRQVWIGTRGEGLYRVNLLHERINHYPPSREKGILSNAFLCIKEDQKGHIWMGTRGGGLIRYSPKDSLFTSFSTYDGLPSQTIVSIEVDLNNNIWMGTENGIGMYQQDIETFFTFDSEDGVAKRGFVFNSISKHPTSNQILMGIQGGFYSLVPTKFSQNPLLPQTVITSVQAFGDRNNGEGKKSTTLSFHSPICLPFSQNNVSISFSSLDLTAPRKNLYAYRLQGVNDFWIYPENHNRNVVYFDLAPGSYLFEVQSSNRDGIWNPKPAKVAFEILPPFYLSSTAFFLYGVSLLLLGYVLFILSRRWFRLRRSLFQQKISQEKDRQHHKMRMVFFTDISHELRTPLTLILSSLEILWKKGEYSLKPKHFQRLYANGLKMKELVDQVMDIRKLSEGEFTLQVVMGECVGFVKRVVIPFSDLALHQEIKLEIQSKEQTINGFFDSFLLEKVLANLLSNAIKFTPQGGRVAVSISTKQMEENELPGFTLTAGRYLSVQVADNGIGIDTHDLPHIFERYYQAQSTQPAHTNGTGIGMELVQKLVLLHKGAIVGASKKNEYTRFKVFIPLDRFVYREVELSDHAHTLAEPRIHFLPLVSSEAQEKKEDPLPIRDNTAKSCDILLVEDNKELREMMREFLSEHYTVAIAENGDEGWEKARLLTPKLIISDILMPKMDGLKMLTQLKSEGATQHIPVLMLTAKGTDKVKRRSIRIGATDFITKPFSLDFVYWKIQQVLQHQATLKEKYSKKISPVPTAPELIDREERFLQSLVRVIEDNLANKELGVSFLATEIGMSRANLYRRVQKVLNDTPVNFIKQIRMKRAQQLLDSGSYYVSEVAYMCGFSTQKYFSKCFQKEFGCSPSSYKNRRNRELERES